MTPERDPSIHISKSKLTQVLQELVDSGVIKSNIALTDLAKRITLKSCRYSLINRSITITNDKLDKKVEKLNASLKEDSILFANTFYLLRKKKKHVGIMLITPTHKDWPMVKMVTELANDFSNGLDFPSKKIGYIEYITTALDMMGNKIAINRFPGLHERICDEYQSKKEAKADSNKEITETLCKLYNRKVLDMTGINEDIASKSDSLSYFVKASKVCKDYRVSPQVYMEAQFDGLAFTNSIPYPSQMVGDKAIERLIRYMSKMGIKARGNITNSGSWLDINALNKLKK